MSEIDLEQRPSLADFELLAEVSQLLTVLDLDRVLERVIDLTARAVGAQKVSLFLHHQESNTWQRLFFTRQIDPNESLNVVQSVLDKGVAGWVTRNRQGTIVYDTETDERWHTFPNDHSTVRSALCLPLMRNDDILAVITLVHTEPNHFNEHHLRLLTIIANQISVAVRNAQLFNQMLEQQHQLEAIIRAIPDVLLVVSEEGRILIVNESAAKFLAQDTDALIGLSLDSLFQVDSAFQPLQKLLDNPEIDNVTWTFDTRSDRFRQDFTALVSQWRSPFGGLTGHVIIMHDVTTLRDLNRFKSEMLKMASHDLRSPLSLIVGYCDLIGLDAPQDDGSPLMDYLDVIKRSTHRMSSLLDDLLRVEEIRTSPDELQKPTDFIDLVTRVVDNLKMLANAKKQQVEIVTELDGLQPLTLAPMLIREAMENLASNAVKYTPEGGTIRVHSFYDERHVHFTVEDNGAGIPERDVAHVFEWGFRSKRHTDAAIDGKGLGLSMVKSVVERHRGEVWVESEEGVGSRFGFWLPR